MESINMGMQLKFMIEADQLENIFSVVGEEITILNKGWLFLGTLLRVASKKRKDENGDFFIWKELTILIENISLENEIFSFPDKKDFFIDKFEIVV